MSNRAHISPMSMLRIFDTNNQDVNMFQIIKSNEETSLYCSDEADFPNENTVQSFMGEFKSDLPSIPASSKIYINENHLRSQRLSKQ